MNESRLEPVPSRRLAPQDRDLHPAWRELIRYCSELGHGELEKIVIQDGLPVLAEITRKKVRFLRPG